MSDWLEARSEYLQYLPQVFRGGGGDGAGEREFLPDLLLAFQKILTGVRAEDGFEDKTRITSTHDRPDYEPLESIIDQLDRFFDPFRTDPEFLDWLASWVALELRPDWTHAEKRKMIARMVRVVKRVGLKSGLYDFLDIYAKEQVRPRIVIDDDEALFRIVLNDDGSTSVNVLAYASLEAWGGRQVPFLYRPTAIAVNPHADPAQVRDLVADAGRAGRKYPPEIQPSLWLLQPNGEPDNLHWSGTALPRTARTHHRSTSRRSGVDQLRPSSSALRLPWRSIPPTRTTWSWRRGRVSTEGSKCFRRSFAIPRDRSHRRAVTAAARC